ncbi:SCAN domain-containing protein 1 [Ochotona curzoniae]|uniref:SCAN domain-containing protein 1 n=1 Tax=Ochotona curzoniae TaxID=130825 RepID=UPI001B35177C|nr:SCAN domain-containing protein 1 [Ochotona curzoniae]
MAESEPSLVAAGSPSAAALDTPEDTGPSADPEGPSSPSAAAASLEAPEDAGSSPAPEEQAWPPEAVPAPPAALELPSPAEAAPRSPPGSGGSRPGPETFRQRFRQFRYQDAAGPREAFRQLRELSRQWLRPDIRTKEQIVQMLVQEQLLAILPEEARARRLRRRADVRITG